jgi:hypothetical protein
LLATSGDEFHRARWPLSFGINALTAHAVRADAELLTGHQGVAGGLRTAATCKLQSAGNKRW